MSTSKLQEPEEVKVDEYRCKKCLKKCSTQWGLGRHVKYSCRGVPLVKVPCRHCGKEIAPSFLLRHTRQAHPEIFEQQRLKTFEMTPANEELAKMVAEMGDPGGDREVRAGCEFLYDEKFHVIRYSVEMVDSASIGTPRETASFAWISDMYLPKKLRFGHSNLPKRPIGWHFAHVVSYSYHNFREDRKATVRLSSVGCFQHQRVNFGPWRQLECAFKFLSLGYRTFVWSGTVLGDEPQTHQTSVRRFANSKGGKGKYVPLLLGVPEYLFKIAVVKDKEGGWLWDAYLIKNDETSTMSPNAYRKTLEEIREKTGLTFLGKIKKLRRADLYAEGNALKWEWRRQNPNIYDIDLDETQSIADSGFADDDDFGDDLEEDGENDDNDTEPEEVNEVDPKDVRIRDLEEELVHWKDRFLEENTEKEALKAEKEALKAEKEALKAEIVMLRVQLKSEGVASKKRKKIS